MKSALRTAEIVLVGCLTVVGCSEPPAAGPGPAAKPTPFDAAAAKARALTEATEQAAEADAAVPGDQKPVAAELQQVAYEPPFPDRLDLFQPPKQGVRVARQTAGESAETVVLLGFAKLDQPQVLLSIDDIIRPLASGEEIAGVKVISIAPPRAVLQRGRSRWTASIE